MSTVLRQVRYTGNASWRDADLPFPGPATSPLNRAYTQFREAQASAWQDSEPQRQRLNRLAERGGYKIRF